MTQLAIPDFAKAILETGVTYETLTIGELPLRRSKLTWCFQDTDNAALIRFRERFALERVIASAQDDWHAIRLLGNWAHQQNPQGGKDLSRLAGRGDAETLLLAINAGGQYWCTYYARITQTVLQAMGFPARHLGVSCEYDRFNKSTYHGVTEAWVNSLRKWVLMDTHFNTHYSLDGRILNAYELHRAAIEGKKVATLKGPDGIRVANSCRECTAIMDEGESYFWRCYDLRSEPFSDAGNWEGDQLALLTDESHDGLTWWQNDRKKHHAYGGRFLETRDVEDVYPDLNSVYLEPQVKRFACGQFVCNAGTYTPNLDRVEVRTDGGLDAAGDLAASAMVAAPGDNCMEVRAVNKLGRSGPITALRVGGVKHPA